MVCSARVPLCSGRLVGSGISPGVGDLLATLLLAGIVGTAGAFLYLALTDVMPVAGSIAARTGVFAGGLAAVITSIALVAIIIGTWVDRCFIVQGSDTCASGAILHIEDNDMSASLGEDVFPFTMMHDRVDVVTKSESWDDIERNAGFVFCTSEPSPRTSEILRCYFRDERICAAGIGAVIGGSIGGLAGILVAMGVAAAIGCATVILCIFAVVAAILVAALVTLVGASLGSNIGRAMSEDTSPVARINVGDYVAIAGNLVQRGFDLDANVLWWSRGIGLAGRTASTSHCEIDELRELRCPPPDS